MAINSKQKGSSFERKVCKMLRLYGYTAETSRYLNKKLDDKGVDIVTDLPLNIQCKATEKYPKFAELLSNMPDNKTPCIVHKMNNKRPTITFDFEEFMIAYHNGYK
jgi:hypothetical protein